MKLEILDWKEYDWDSTNIFFILWIDNNYQFQFQFYLLIFMWFKYEISFDLNTWDVYGKCKDIDSTQILFINILPVED